MEHYSYNRKFYKTFVGKAYRKICTMIGDNYDKKWDNKICGTSLVKYVPFVDGNEKGYTGSQSTRYWALDKIFEGKSFSADDHFIDVGCGKGRVLAYMVRESFPGKISGIELNQPVAEYAQKWAEKYDNVSVVYGDALKHDYNQYTILFLGRPFFPELFEQFINKIENDLTHPIKFYYWVDQQSGDFLNDRAGWSLEERKWLFKKNGVLINKWPQRYSIWSFDPSKK